jgi:hypothetical protein
MNQLPAYDLPYWVSNSFSKSLILLFVREDDKIITVDNSANRNYKQEEIK